MFSGKQNPITQLPASTYLTRSMLQIVAALIVFGTSDNLAQAAVGDTSSIPITRVFYRMADNLTSSFTYNYGLNYAIAGAGTYGIVKSGIDWKWYRNSQDHPWISNAGFIPVGIGQLAPVVAPVALYLYGHWTENSKLQLTGLAIGQAAIDAVVMTSVLKAFTGRVPPDSPENLKDYSGGFRFGFLRGGVYEGWPSSHTATSFAVVTTLIELYPENVAIRYGGLVYATLIGLGVSTNIHWLSDAFAGGFVGWAIGHCVGESYRDLIYGAAGNQTVGFQITPTGIQLVLHF
jgi:membrane-associated phospholipid phosphatase